MTLLINGSQSKSRDQDLTHPYFIEEMKGGKWETFGRYTSEKECERVYREVLMVYFPNRQYRLSVLPEYREYLKSKGILDV